MRTADLVKTLRTLDVTPNRQLGQSFLVDDELSQWIVDQLDIRPNDIVIEVGPGMGALTKHLLGRPRRLILIEKDARLAEYLQDHYTKQGWKVEVICQDACNFDPRALFKEGPIKLIGNLPYSAGTEILRTFLTQPSPFEKAVIMLQKEVCKRITAEPKTKPYGVLSLMMQSEWIVQMLKTVGPEQFHPRPEVDSSIIKFEPRPPKSMPTYSPQIFREVVKQGFSQRRKQLHNNLTCPKETWQAAAEKMGLPESSRAEELTLHQWITLSNLLDQHPSKSGGQSADEIFDIVDEHDEVIGQETRGITHERKLLHRAVHIFVFNKAGELYLQKRSHLKDTHAGKWDSSASGHVDSGETYEGSAVRELKEELMVRPRKGLELVGKLPASAKTDQEFVGLFRCEHSGKIRIHGNEVFTGGFFPLEEIADWVEDRPQDFATAFIECFRFYVINVVAKGTD